MANVNSEILGAASRHEGNSGSENFEPAWLWPLDENFFRNSDAEMEQVLKCSMRVVRMVCSGVRAHLCMRVQLFRAARMHARQNCLHFSKVFTLYRTVKIILGGPIRPKHANIFSGKLSHG